MATVIDLGSAPLARVHENFWLEGGDASPGPGLDGREQVVFTENRRWIGRLDMPHLFPDALSRAVTIGDQLRGRANVLRVTLCNHRTLRWQGDAAVFEAAAGVTGPDADAGRIPFSDTATFQDGAGFALPDHDEPTAVSAAAAGASTLALTGYLGRHLAVAAFFSINDFLYRVEANADGQVTFNPPLREAVAAGATVEVSAPKIRVRLSDARDWRPFCNYFRIGRPLSVNVVEAFDR